MADVRQFRLPDVGEGLTEAEIIRWRVQPGDVVAHNQVLVEIETAKALVELPSPFAGRVTELLVPEGQTVPVGTPLIAIDVAAAAEPQSPDRPSGTSERTAVLVGYGPREASGTRRRRRPTTSSSASEPSRAVAAAFHSGTPETHREILAKPPVRKLARDLGIDLRTLSGSGPNGVITRQDVEAAATHPPTPQGTPSVAVAAGGGREERIPIRGVRREMAAAMVRSAFSIPHVTEFVTIDASASMETLDRLRAQPEFAEVKLTPLTLAAKAVLLALRRYPMVNAFWDDAAGEIVVRHYVNLGIAAATPRGLVVPNIKDADRLTFPDLARAINQATALAREGRTPVADLQHGTFTITNVGVFGVDTGTPIINPGEAAILALGAIRRAPWVHQDVVQPRWVTTLGLSFDHRIIDGELGSRFLREVAAFLEDPAAVLLSTS
ncbi:MAG: 2-oxo acid dehydrogenase subunit E2 [Acidothermus sp.]|nr:2-oxo acid dehydrogenase subunit E2 [Acidothermus sp.]MCL6537317.1 2-oxo acid dehydrogenase subunit E2 [Acidothermus sp.]